MFGGELGAIIGLQHAMYSRPGEVIPVKSATEMALDERARYYSTMAQLQGQALFHDAVLAGIGTHHGRIRNYIPRKGYRERKFMRKTKAGYRARRTVEVMFWSAVGVVVLGGIVLPVGLRVYTALWTWALGGG